MANDDYLPKIFRNFSGGQVSSMNPRSLAENELVKAYDVEIDERGCLKTRPRWQWFNETQVGIDAPTHGIHSFFDRDGREWLFIVGLNSVSAGIILRGTIASEMDFASNGGGILNWLINDGSVSSNAHFNYPYPRSFTNYHSDLIMAHMQYTGIIIIRFHHNWIDTGTLTGGTGQLGYQLMYWPLQAHIVTIFQNRLVLANTARGQNFIHWSAPELGIPDQFISTSPTTYSEDVDLFNPEIDASEGSNWKNIYPNDGDGIVAASEWNGILGIFRRRSLLIMDSNFNVYKVHQGYGTASCYSVTLTPFGWAFIDYDGKGIFLWNGSSDPPKKISQQIDDEWQEMDITPPMEIGSKLWDTEEAFEETGDTGAGISNLTWDSDLQTWGITAGQTSGTWTSNVMTTEKDHINWLNIRPEITMSETTFPVYTTVQIKIKSGTSVANCLAASWRVVAFVESYEPIIDSLWFIAFPSIIESSSATTLVSDPSHNFIQICITLSRNAVGTTSCQLGKVRLNYVHGDDPTTDFGRWPNVHWDGEKLWVNVWDGNTDHAYTFRTFVWDPKLNIWTRWKNANPACMTQFDKRTVWGTSYALLANHALRFTDQNKYSPTITADPAINPHIEIPYWDGGDPCRMKQLELVRLSWKDSGTGTLIVKVSVQRPPKGLTFDSDGNPLSNDPSPPPLEFLVPITLTGSGEDRVWNIGTRELMLAYNLFRGEKEKSATGSSSREYAQGYGFKIELMNNWVGSPAIDFDDIYWGNNTEFTLNSIELRATLLGDNKQIDVPQEV